MISGKELYSLLEQRSCGCIIINGMLRNIAWPGIGPNDIEIWFYNPAQMSKPIVSYIFTLDEIGLLIRNKPVVRPGFDCRLGFTRW